MSIDRAPVIRKIFMYLQKLGGAEEVCTRRRSENDERRTHFTDSDKWIYWSIIPRPKCISRRYDRMDVCLYRACPISNSSVGFPCYLARLHKRSASRRSFLRPLRTLFTIAIYYHTNITSSAWILLSVSASMCVPLCAIKVTSTFTPKIYAAEIKKGNFGIYAEDLRRRN